MKDLSMGKLSGWLLSLILLVGLSLGLSSCGGGGDRLPSHPGSLTALTSSTLTETAPPPALRQLQPALANYQPQVVIASPANGATLETPRVEVKLRVSDLPLYKDKTLGLGPHLRLSLDNQPPRDIYDLDQPVSFEALEPGTHTLRAFAVTPWQESFKNAGAYAQTTFNLFTATPGSAPTPTAPLLTYNSPQGSYGAEPILLDFYLSNTPLHLVAQENPDDEIRDWRVRVTINGESFLLQDWQPIYLQGFQPGTNWVKLELIDDTGEPIANAFNATARLVEYDPTLNDTLAQLTRGDLTAAAAQGIVDPNYEPAEGAQPPEPVAEPEPAAEPPANVAPEAEPKEGSDTVLEAEPTLEVAPEPTIAPEPEVESEAAVKPEPSKSEAELEPVTAPEPEVEPEAPGASEPVLEAEPTAAEPEVVVEAAEESASELPQAVEESPAKPATSEAPAAEGEATGQSLSDNPTETLRERLRRQVQDWRDRVQAPPTAPES